MRHLAWWGVAAVATCLALVTPVAATILSSSQLEWCTNGSTGSNEPTGCTQKFVVTLAVDGGVTGGSAVLAWTSVTDSEGISYTLNDTVEITVTKSLPRIRYPVAYVRNFNAAPSERTIYTPLFQCHSAATDAAPTCGRAYSSTGAAIAYSEGFCCSCSACSLFGLCTDSERAKTRCSLFGAAAAASCLEFGDLWYSGYTIGAAQTWYTIEVAVKLPGGSREVLTLSPGSLGASSATVIARLVGDFAPFEQPPNLEYKMLFVPAEPATSSIVQAGSSEWMLVPSSGVTVDGTDCNKVGVSYEAFAGQGSRCDLAVGACLSNQLSDLRASDATRVAAGKTPQYLASATADFAAYSGASATAARAASTSEDSAGAGSVDLRRVNGTRSREANGAASDGVYLAYTVRNVQASVVTLVLAASRIGYRVDVARGSILSASVAGFAATSDDGRLTIIWMNTDALTAAFYVGVSACATGLVLPSQRVQSAAPREVVTTVFALSAIAGIDDAWCNVTLKSALYEVLDWRVTKFNVSSIVTDNGAQGGTQSPGASGGVSNSDGTADGTGDCSSCAFYNVLCYIVQGCSWQAAVQTAVVAGLAGTAFLIWKYRDVISACCCSSSSRSRSRAKRRPSDQSDGSDRTHRHAVEIRVGHDVSAPTPQIADRPKSASK